MTEDYPLFDLSLRPIEHILESLPARTLARILHINKDTAARMKREPWTFVDTAWEMNEEQEQRLRAELRVTAEVTGT